MDRQVAAYTRGSTERQAETQTIEQQIARVRVYAQQQGWSLPEERIYQDDGRAAPGWIGRPWIGCGMPWRAGTWRRS